MAGVNLIGTGEPYSTISGWESSTNTGSLTGIEEGQLKSEVFSEIVLIDGGATTASDYCHLTAANGSEFDHATETGARIVVTGIASATDVVMIKDPYHRWGGNTANNGSSTGSIGIRYESLTGANNCSAMRMRQAGSNVIRGLIMYRCISGGNAFGYRDDGSNSGGRIDLYNSAAINIETTSSVGGDAIGFNRDGGTVNSYTHYCNAHDIRAAAGSDDAIGFRAMAESNNCWSGECVSQSATGQSDGFYAIGSMTTCASSDATGSAGLQNLASVDQFVSSVSPYDLHLASGSSLIDAGTDSYSVTTDIDGSVAGARNDVGFHEYVISGGALLVVDGVLQSQALQSIELSQHGVLGIGNVGQAQLIDSVLLAQHSAISVNNSQQQQSVASVVISQNSVLSVAKVFQGQDISSISITQNGILSIFGADQGQAIGSVSLATSGQIVVDSAQQPQSIDGVSLSQNSALVNQSIYQPQLIDSVVLSVAGQLAIAELLQQQALGNVTLSESAILSMSSVLQGQQIDVPALTERAALTASSMAQQQQNDNVILSLSDALAIDWVAQAQYIDAVSISENGVLVVVDIAQAQSADMVALSQHNVLVVYDIEQFQQIQAVGIGSVAGWLEGSLVVIRAVDGALVITRALDGALTIN